MKAWQFRPRSFPFALLIYCLLSFGLLIPWLGFYWDDWPSIYYLHVLGPRGFIDAFAGDRPSLGWFFMVTSTIMGESTLAWQVFGLLARWWCSLALWWLLRSLWPGHIRQVTWVALLFAAYPGFLQQYIAVTYSHTWTVLAFFFVSLGAMLWAIRQPRFFWPLMALSWILAAFCMFTDEYFFGLELLRPILLWLVMDSQSKASLQKFGRTVSRWLPFAVLMAVFLVWRLIIHESPRGQVQIFDDLRQSPIETSLDLVEEVSQDVVESSVIAWGQVFNISRQLRDGTGPAVIYVIAVITAFTLASLYLTRFVTLTDNQPPPGLTWRWPVQAVLIGAFALLIGGIPFWVTHLPIDLRFPWDRFTLAMNLGASLLIVGILELLFRNKLVNTLLLAALLALAAGMHVQLANTYRREWNSQKTFFWQLVWRAPAIQPGTMVLTAELPFTYYSDNSLTAPLNWTYAPELTSRQIPYLFFNVESRLGGSLAGFERGLTIEENYRALSFTGSTSQALAIYYNPPGCVKFVDPSTDARTPQKPLYFSKVLGLSQPGLILSAAIPAASPPQAYFGPEPEHNWCYYFEKADLARQHADWKEVARLGDLAFQLNTRLYEVNAPELLPFIEAYAFTGNWEKATALSLDAYDLTFRIQRILCDTWTRIDQVGEASSQGKAYIGQMLDQLNCSAP